MLRGDFAPGQGSAKRFNKIIVFLRVFFMPDVPGLHPAYNTPPLDERSKALRRHLVRMVKVDKRGHIGPALSLFEILRVLYDDVLRFDANNPRWPERDRCILSKGHGCIALYAVLADKGFFPMEEFDRFCRKNGILGGHPEYGKVPGVEASTGALGHGLPIGLGMALAARAQKRDSRVFVVMGDGETNEGSVWEAALCIGKHRLSNLTAIIDYNKIQSAGYTRDIQTLEPIMDKWRAFNFETVEVDGHDVAALQKVFKNLPLQADKPTAVICHTVKGKGFSFAENEPKWHHQSGIKPEVLAQMDDELKAA
jgi:transketolase